MDGTVSPKVSVIISAYNMAAYTAQAIESVLAQTFKDYELIVVDDGSTDNTRAVVNKYGEKVRYFYKKNGGVASARNYGLGLSRGQYIALLDCDDLWLPDKLAETMKGFINNTGLVYTNGYFIDSLGMITGSYQAPKISGPAINRLLVMNFILNPSVVIKKECFERLGLFNEALFFAADWDMWLRIAEKYELCHIPAPLSKYRIVRTYKRLNPEKTKNDEIAVLADFFERNKSFSQKQMNIAKSRVYMEYAYNSFRNRDIIVALKAWGRAFMLAPVFVLLKSIFYSIKGVR